MTCASGSCADTCCTGVAAVTPTPVFNPPGQPALAYRAGTYATFRESMLARLSSRRALDPLTTREPDDPAIALLDCWAVVGEVLTFYQERIANEGYLRTATEPESLGHLGLLAGHRPRPPLGAGTHLAYTLDPGAHTLIPAGSGVKSQAAAGQLPQTFETSEDLVARAEWNTLAVRLTDPPDISRDNVDTLVTFAVDGTTANLRQGDRLLFAFAPSGLAPDVHARTVAESAVDFTAGRTQVTLVSPTTPLGTFSAAVATLSDAVRTATGDAVTRTDPAAGRIVADVLTPLAALLLPTLTPAAALFEVAPELQRLTEAVALAAGGAACALADWLDGDLATVRRDGAALLVLAARLARRTDPELTRLRSLARSSVCPVSCEADIADDGGDTCPDPYQAIGLVALTPVLPALRRPPSRPPASARALDTSVQQLFQPDSDAHLRLLAAADLRLTRLYDAWRRERITDPPPLAALVVLRVRAAVALARRKTPASDNRVDQILLDSLHDTILPGRPVLVGTGDGTDTLVLFPDRVLPAQLDVTDPSGRKIGEVTVTMLEFDTPVDGSKLAGGTPLRAQGEPLTPVGAPVTDDVGGAAIDLAQCYDGLKPGRWIVVSGERTDVPHTSGVQAAELALIAGVAQRLDRTVDGSPVLQRGQGPQTRLLLANDLAYTYRRSGVAIFGNVVAATQGETRDDVLGSGDASVPGQAFPLHFVSDATPLTRTAADNPLGAQSSLTTRVNGVAWHETPALALNGPNDHAYELRGATVTFGDGEHGARLPTGTQNVTARYRTGAGASGNLPPGKVNQLAARPLGVSAVTNPLPATGGTDGDGPDDARSVIPLRLRALDRLVSVQDYEDFTRARAGIGKASAVKLFDGTREVVHVTVAAVGDAPIDPPSGLLTTLERSLLGFGDIGVPVRVATRELRLIVLDAGVKVLADHAWELVEPAVRAALTARFGFAARTLGRPAYLSEAIATIQGVEGVDYTDVHVFADVPGDVTAIQLAQLAAGLTTAKACLPALPAHFEQIEHGIARTDTLTTISQRYGLSLAELAELNPALDSPELHTGRHLTIHRGIRPAQLAVLPADVPEALTLRRLP
ncbi:putative baseplate assembly protein [Streptomyces sp. SP17BM10]|uniref:putative baseplate assembly protein n=1 Tax=Streptomyces sp. SP17BM10 TaxID=3002530 RepID=UPI002E76053F|nr:putative baseplate assembly protein [Streptomyces sp. SP17BM10]MEE1782980.1 putative baseplate assembly protein [Streptomyces sp. SP17BM10]